MEGFRLAESETLPTPTDALLLLKGSSAREICGQRIWEQQLLLGPLSGMGLGGPSRAGFCCPPAAIHAMTPHALSPRLSPCLVFV